MPNIVITPTTNAIKVDFGDYGGGQIPTEGTWRKDKIINFQNHGTYVTARTVNGEKWNLVHTANGVNLVVDTVAGAAPTSNNDLFDKLSALIE